jgi:hypothetical protein
VCFVGVWAGCVCGSGGWGCVGGGCVGVCGVYVCGWVCGWVGVCVCVCVGGEDTNAFARFFVGLQLNKHIKM